MALSRPSSMSPSQSSSKPLQVSSMGPTSPTQVPDHPVGPQVW